MSPRSLLRIATGVAFAFIMVVFVLLLLEKDADDTERCIDAGYSADYCGWR